MKGEGTRKPAAGVQSGGDKAASSPAAKPSTGARPKDSPTGAQAAATGKTPTGEPKPATSCAGPTGGAQGGGGSAAATPAPKPESGTRPKDRAASLPAGFDAAIAARSTGAQGESGAPFTGLQAADPTYVITPEERLREGGEDRRGVLWRVREVLTGLCLQRGTLPRCMTSSSRHILHTGGPGWS